MPAHRFRIKDFQLYIKHDMIQRLVGALGEYSIKDAVSGASVGGSKERKNKRKITTWNFHKIEVNHSMKEKIVCMLSLMQL